MAIRVEGNALVEGSKECGPKETIGLEDFDGLSPSEVMALNCKPITKILHSMHLYHQKNIATMQAWIWLWTLLLTPMIFASWSY
jgi:hypothetical protein